MDEALAAGAGPNFSAVASEQRAPIEWSGHWQSINQLACIGALKTSQK
jgi:hypothetical protein